MSTWGPKSLPSRVRLILTDRHLTALGGIPSFRAMSVKKHAVGTKGTKRKPPSSLPFDAGQYVRAPVLNIASAISLGQALCKRCPTDAPGNVKRSCKLATQQAQESWTERQRLQTKQPGISADRKREVDILTDQGFGALRQNLESHAMLPSGRSKKADRAHRLLGQLFPDGLGFLNWKYAEQLAAMEVLLGRIDSDGLAGDIDAVCGPEFLANIRTNLLDYRSMVLHAEVASLDVSLIESVRQVAEAVVDYAVSVCGTVDRHDPQTIRQASKLLQPIDALREQLQRGGGSEPSPTPAAPTPSDPSK